MGHPHIHISEKMEEGHSKEIERIFELYNAENDVATYKKQDVAVTLTDSDGAFIGGIEGYSAWGWMHIKTVAIKKEYRGGGYGLKLLEHAEQEAIKRGCTGIYLNTMSFQAPAFYKKAGFEAYGSLGDCPTGHERIFYKKRLK